MALFAKPLALPRHQLGRGLRWFGHSSLAQSHCNNGTVSLWLQVALAWAVLWVVDVQPAEEHSCSLPRVVSTSTQRRRSTCGIPECMWAFAIDTKKGSAQKMWLCEGRNILRAHTLLQPAWRAASSRCSLGLGVFFVGGCKGYCYEMHPAPLRCIAPRAVAVADTWLQTLFASLATTGAAGRFGTFPSAPALRTAWGARAATTCAAAAGGAVGEDCLAHHTVAVVRERARVAACAGACARTPLLRLHDAVGRRRLWARG